MINIKLKLDSLNLIEDKKAKSKTFFLDPQDNARRFEIRHIKFLKEYYSSLKRDIRICLHKDINSIDQNMVLLQSSKNYYPPHKHLYCGDTYHIIEGKLLVCFFSEDGKLIKKNIVKKNEIFKTPPKVYHSTKPLTDIVIFHESRAGKFDRLTSSIFPNWLPKTKNDKKQFNKKILNEKI